MKATRREFLFGGAFTAAGLLTGRALARNAQHQHHVPQTAPTRQPAPPSEPVPSLGAGILPVEIPDIPKLPWHWENGVKVFHLIAEAVKGEFVPGKVFDLWGYNGSCPGPTIEVTEGDRVRIIVENHLPEITSVHWHGVELPIEMDGVPGVTQDPIPPGGRFVYEFDIRQNGTFFYHSHMAMQEMLGMIGFFIMHPRKLYTPHVHRDFGIILQEWAILPNNTVPNTMSMEFNWLTFNGKAAPATTPLIVKQGERVRIRLVNLGMDHHPIHLHGHQFYITGTEGGRVPESAWYPTNTVLVGVAQAKDVEFEAKYLGDWMLHCHLPHHMMNQMVSMVGPMTHVGQGLHTGMGMEEGMGIVRQDQALSEELGPSLGRGMGHGPERERATANMPVLPAQAEQHGMQHGEAKSVPGFPQDAHMFMPMDEAVAKPETYGLRPTWSGGLMGMMTLVRVLPPDLYDKIMALKKEKPASPPETRPPAHQHKHSG